MESKSDNSTRLQTLHYRLAAKEVKAAVDVVKQTTPKQDITDKSIKKPRLNILKGTFSSRQLKG